MKKYLEKAVLPGIVVALCSLIAGFFSLQESQEVVNTPDIPRPVTVMKLEKTDPLTFHKRTGIADAWKVQKIGFEVSGTVEWVIEESTDVEGVAKTTHADNSSGGTVVARLDSSRYKSQLTIRKAELEVALSEAEALTIQIDKVMKHQLSVAQTQFEQNKNTFQREKDLFEKKATSEQKYEAAEAAFKISESQKIQAAAEISSLKAQLKGKQAQIALLNERVKDAARDVERCTLRSPYSGRVSRVSVSAGTTVQPGTPIVEVSIMDPIRISINVSPAVDRVHNYREIIEVLQPGTSQRQRAMVNRKGTVADPSTHTFNLSLLTRNSQAPSAKLPESILSLPRIGNIWHVISTSPHDKDHGMMSVAKMAVQRDADGAYVWKATRHGSSPQGATLYQLDKVPVTIGETVIDAAGSYEFATLLKHGSLNYGDCIAQDVPQTINSGDIVAYIPERWIFRPGDLVDVVLKGCDSQPGYYVPMNAIVRKADKSYIFVVQNGVQTVSRIEITTVGSLGEHLRIQSPELHEGLAVVMKGVHYLKNDEPIVIAGYAENHL